MLFLISNINVKANSSVDLTSAEYDDYYVNSDLIYDMSDVDNIAPFEYNGSTYTIDEYRDSLFNCNMTFGSLLTRATAYEDDPIVNIIPRDYFMTEGTFYKVGTEYCYIIKTEFVEYSRSDYYKSHVMVIDIDNNIENEGFDVENNLIISKVTKLFELNYLTLLNSEDFGNPEGLRDTVNFESFIKVDESYTADSIVVAYPTNTGILYYGDDNNWYVENIKVFSDLKNINSLNNYDVDYDVNSDTGCFFVSSSIDYRSTLYQVEENSMLGDLIWTSWELISSSIPVLGKVCEYFNTAIDLTRDYGINDNTSIMEYVKTTEITNGSSASFFYSTREGQISNYQALVKDSYLYLDDTPLYKKDDYFRANIHYSYSNGTAQSDSTRYSEVITFDVSSINNDLTINTLVSRKSKTIGLEEEEVSITSPLRDEYLLNGCRCVYIVTPDYTQQYTINAGLNDIIVKDSEGNIIGEDNIVYLTKNQTYYIYVSNNNSEAIIYDFYIAGYDIEDHVSMSLQDTYLFTYVSDFTGVKYFDSNLLLEVFNYNDIIYFQDGEIYYILITNSTFNTAVPWIEINDIENIVLDDDGYITNTSKYVKVCDIEEGVYQVVGNPANMYNLYNEEFTSICNFNLFYYSDETNLFILNGDYSIEKICDKSYSILVNDIEFVSTTVYTINRVANIGLKSNCDNIVFEMEYLFVGNNPVEKVKLYSADEVNATVTYYIIGEGGHVLEYPNGVDYHGVIDLTVIYTNEGTIDIEDSTYEVDGNRYIKTYTIKFYDALYCLNFDLSFEGTTIEAYVNKDENHKLFTFTIDYDLASKTILTYKTINIVYASGTTLPNKFTITNKNNNKTIYSCNANSITLKCSVFNMKNGKFGIENTTQFKYFINYYQYGSFSYSDYVNSDIEIYGNINDEFFELLNSIYFNGEIVEVSTSIIFNGLFNGNGFSINGLVLHATWSSNAFGLFSELYGTFMNVTFENCRILSSGDTYLHKYIGFITVFNYGYIADVEFINVVYLSLDVFYNQIQNDEDKKEYYETTGIVITSPQNFIYI